MSRLHRRERGQALVEFALALPILILVLVGIFDGGRLVFAYHTVNNAAREAGREATVNQTEADIRARALQHAVALDLVPADVTVSYLDGDGSGACPGGLGSPQMFGCLAVVTVSYEFNAATPVISAFVNPITVTGEVRFPVEFVCSGSIAGNDCPLGD